MADWFSRREFLWWVAIFAMPFKRPPPKPVQIAHSCYGTAHYGVSSFG